MQFSGVFLLELTPGTITLILTVGLDEWTINRDKLLEFIAVKRCEYRVVCGVMAMLGYFRDQQNFNTETCNSTRSNQLSSRFLLECLFDSMWLLDEFKYNTDSTVKERMHIKPSVTDGQSQ